MALQQKSQAVKQRTPKAAVVAAAAAAAEAGRSLSCFRVGKIQTEAGQALCIVRTISPGLIALDIEVPFAGADEAALVIGGDTVTGALVFVDGKKAELRPRQEVDPAQILADASLLARAGRRTLPRIQVDARARLEVMGQSMSARICDISTDGAKVLVDDLLCTGDRVTLALRGLQMRLTGLVRWAVGDHAGIEFDQPLAIGQLNLWLAAQLAPAVEPDWGLVSKS